MAKNQYQLVTFFLNGKEVEKMVDVRASLTDMLRSDFSMTSVKKGCEVGECGACNVLIDGECYNSCLYLAVWAEGKHITTLEGLMGPNGELSDIQQAFMEETAIQDKRRASYCEYYASKKWGAVDAYDFCLNSSALGLGGTVELIQAMVAHKEHPIPSPTEIDPTQTEA